MASQAESDGMQRIGLEYANQKLCAPHTWHAAEAFLYLIEERQAPDEEIGDDN
jgi:hypothetical protein